MVIEIINIMKKSMSEWWLIDVMHILTISDKGKESNPTDSLAYVSIDTPLMHLVC